MKFIAQFTVLFLVLLIHFQSIHSAATPKKKDVKIDNRLICMKGKKDAKLSEIEYVGTVRTSVDLRTFFTQFSPRHVIPKESKKSNWVSPKFIKGTLSAIARRECRSLKDQLGKDEIFGIIFANGKQLLSLFHDQDFKWSGNF